MWRFSLNLEFGKADPDEPQHYSATDAVTSQRDPDWPPIGFAPACDPIRRGED